MYPFFVQIAYQHHGNRPGVYPAGVVAHHIGFFQVADLLQDLGHQHIETQEFGNHPHQVRIKGIGFIDLVHHLLTFGAGQQQTGFFQLVQLHAHGIGGVAKFFGQAAQMPHGVRSAEKLEQELQAGLAGDEGSEDGRGFLRLRRRTASPGHPQLSTAVCFSE